MRYAQTHAAGWPRRADSAMIAAAVFIVCGQTVPETGPVTPALTVNVDLGPVASDRSNREWLAELYKSLLVRITDEGMAVIGSEGTAAVTLRLAPIRRGRIKVEVHSACDSVTGVEVDVEHDLASAVSLRVMHASMELLRAAQRARDDDASGCSTPPSRETTPRQTAPQANEPPGATESPSTARVACASIRLRPSATAAAASTSSTQTGPGSSR